MSVVSPSFRSRVRANIEAPVARIFTALHLTPNALTLIGFAIAVVGAVFAGLQWWLAAGVAVAVGAVFDLFDGALARVTNSTSRLGAFLDSTFDRAGESAVYIGISYGLITDLPLGAMLALIAMAAAFMVSYTRARSESLGFAAGSGMASVGLAPREVRTVLLVIGLLVAGLVPPPHPILCLIAPCPQRVGDGPLLLTGVLALLALLATITTVQRIAYVYLQARKEPQQ
jgi:archaetidylinositol phosphate synthase